MEQVTFEFKHKGFGWANLYVGAGEQTHDVLCSWSYSPFPDLLWWIERIATRPRGGWVGVYDEEFIARMSATLQPDGSLHFALWRDYPRIRRTRSNTLLVCDVDRHQLVEAFYHAYTDPRWTAGGFPSADWRLTYRTRMREVLGDMDPGGLQTAQWLAMMPRATINDIFTTAQGTYGGEFLDCAGVARARTLAALLDGPVPRGLLQHGPDLARSVPPAYDGWSHWVRVAFIDQWLDERIRWPGSIERRMRSETVEDWLSEHRG